MTEYYCGFMFRVEGPLTGRRQVFHELPIEAEGYDEAAIAATEKLYAIYEDKPLKISDVKLVSQSCIGPVIPA